MIRSNQMQIRTIRRDSNHSNANSNYSDNIIMKQTNADSNNSTGMLTIRMQISKHSNEIRSKRMQIRTILQG